MEAQIYFWKMNWNLSKVLTKYFKKIFRTGLKKKIRLYSFWYEGPILYRSSRIQEINLRMKISDSFAIEWVARSFKKVNKLSYMIIFILLSVDHWLTTLMNFMLTLMSSSNFQKKKKSLQNCKVNLWRNRIVRKFL
jgi:hypothetical protein